MKKLFSILSFLTWGIVVMAQDNDKLNVCIDDFSYNTKIGTNWVTTLRNNVIEGIIRTGRLNVIDINNLSGLSTVNEERLIQLRESNIDVLVKGHYTALESNAKTRDGKTRYEVASTFTLTLVDTGTGAVIGTENFKNTYLSGETSTESITEALNEVVGDMKKFVDNNFKVEAVIKALDQVDPKKGAKTVYISIGSSAGIQVGQMFDVYQEIEIAGEKGTKLVGTAKAKEIISNALTLCTISKGGNEIKTAFEDGVKLIVVSRARKGPFGDILSL
ncbi:MAG: hypothetical protein LUH22_00895 [Bacteroides sp.]|nr:hypothetical protein [Bacteroides sp.]